MTPQHLQALASANTIRMGGVNLKREIAGGLPVGEAISDPRAQHLRIEALLTAQHRVGATKALALLRRVPVSGTRLVRDLTDRERSAIVTLAETTGRRRAA